MKEKLRDILQGLIDAGVTIGSENGPDADYRRYAREDAEKLLRKIMRKVALK